MIVVTGASGFVGRHLVERLRREGERVIVVGRRVGASTPDEFVHAELTRDAALPHFGGATVVHCAAATRDGFSADVAATNVRLAGSALRLSDGPLIHVSSSSVYDVSKPSVGTPVTAATGDYPWFNSYGPSKLAAERVLSRAGRDVTVLRPHAVYGPGDTTLAPRLRRAGRHGVLPLPGGGSAVHAFTSVENLVQAIVQAVAVRLPGVHTFNVTDPEPVGVRDAVLQVLGRNTRIIDVPLGLARQAGRVAGRLAGSREPSLSEYAVLQLGFDRTYDLADTYDVLGFRPEPTDFTAAATTH